MNDFDVDRAKKRQARPDDMPLRRIAGDEIPAWVVCGCGRFGPS
jgi:hypothetical protein